jgi:hypothetical protein
LIGPFLWHRVVAMRIALDLDQAAPGEPRGTWRRGERLTARRFVDLGRTKSMMCPHYSC